MVKGVGLPATGGIIPHLGRQGVDNTGKMRAGHLCRLAFYAVGAYHPQQYQVALFPFYLYVGLVVVPVLLIHPEPDVVGGKFQVSGDYFVTVSGNVTERMMITFHLYTGGSAEISNKHSQSRHGTSLLSKKSGDSFPLIYHGIF